MGRGLNRLETSRSSTFFCDWLRVAKVTLAITPVSSKVFFFTGNLQASRGRSLSLSWAVFVYNCIMKSISRCINNQDNCLMFGVAEKPIIHQRKPAICVEHYLLNQSLPVGAIPK